ncbi:putative hydrolase [Methanobrevibacter cuticularis]|uniref:Putative hydrolase n=1 Tax=Methanobrevibacter cuticularis TaxID=47311 RepID=A0A166ECN4_9EURY|nr:PHP-associated domain-containing protein [Methanobrevibacter cuticularis]KZX16509.1 putative hydrolase [Methanobrevibacter cuticularis]
MKLDPHIHSCYSGDARSIPKDILKQAKNVGLDVIAISDHNTIQGSKLAIGERKSSDVIIIPSIEISSDSGHILGLGVSENITEGLSPEDTVDKIHDNGGIAIVPHPYSFYRNGLFSDFNNNLTLNLDIEGVETKNARYILGYSNYKGKKLAIKRNLAQIGSSDSHFIGAIGNCYTELTDIAIEDEPSIDDILETIRKRKTIAKGHRTSNYLIAKEVFNKKIRRIY